MNTAQTGKPTALEVRPEGIPDVMRARSQWVEWRYEWRYDHWTKVPYHPSTERRASSTAPATWCSFADALAAYRRGGYDGIGYVFSGDEDDFCGVDLDKCHDPATGTTVKGAAARVKALNSYTEFSPSGSGVHIVVRAKAPADGNKKGNVEIYDQGRFFTVTGHRIAGTPATIEPRQRELEALHREVWPEFWDDDKFVGTKGRVHSGGDRDNDDTPPVDEYGENGLADDDLLRRARGATNGEKFQALYDKGDTSGYDDDDSRADLALCDFLAFYAREGGEAQVDRLFRQSALMRPKWERADYRERTLRKVFSEGREYYSPPTSLNTVTRGCKQKGASTGGGKGDSDRATHTVEEEWVPPIPLDAAVLPAFPVASLPSALHDFVIALARSTQTPEGLAALMTLAAVAIAVQRKLMVQMNDDWREPLNIYTVVVLPSGERKSAVLRAVAAPLEAWEQEKAQADAPLLAERRSKRKILEGRLHKAQRTAAESPDAAKRKEAEEEASTLARELATTPEVFDPQLLADDATPEALATLLYEQGGRMGVLTAEGTPFKLMAGRYAQNGGANLEVYLKAHAGDAIRINRRGRREEVHDPALTMGLLIQPDVLRAIGQQREMRGLGLPARFAYSLPASLIGNRDLSPPPVAEGVRDAYARVIAALLDLPLPQGGEAMPTLILDANAQTSFLAFRAPIEADLKPFARLGDLSDWGGKLPGLVARLAGLLHLVRHASAERPWDEPIDRATMESAITIGGYLIPHALAAFDLMGTDEGVADARYLAGWVERQSSATLAEQEIWQGTKRRFGTAARLHRALALLIEHRYLRPRPAAEGATGRPRRPDYDVNPLLPKPTPNTPNTPADVGGEGATRGFRGRFDKDGDTEDEDAEVGEV